MLSLDVKIKIIQQGVGREKSWESTITIAANWWCPRKYKCCSSRSFTSR